MKQSPQGPQPTDLAEKLIAYRRRTASKSKVKDSDPEHSKPHRKQLAAPEIDDFRRLNISSSSPRPVKLFNPERDPIPTIRRTTEPEVMSDAASSRNRPDSSPRHLFDHRKDDPVRFSVMARPSRPTPTPKSSGDYVSASSTSSYAPSQTSSTFTLSSTTDGSSASSALFENQGRPSEDQGTSNVFALQLKKLYRAITNLEAKIKQEDVEENELANEGGSRIMLKTSEADDDDVEKEKWKLRISDHKRLVEIIHNLLEISLAPSVPASLRNIPTKYNIIARLWTFGFYKLLESLRRAAFPTTTSSIPPSSYPQHSYGGVHRGSSLALEHLTDFLFHAYVFYTGLLEEPQLGSFRNHWLEALGDLARYKMMVEGFLERREKETTVFLGRSNAVLTMKNLSDAVEGMADSLAPPGSLVPNASRDGATRNNSHSLPPKSRVSAGHSDDKNSQLAPSVGPHAAYLLSLELEVEKERWRNVARDWYGMGLSDQPGAGKLHHHIGLLCREVVNGGTFNDRDEKEVLRGVYHYAKSLTTLHPFPTSRESILPLFSPFLQHNSTFAASPITLFILLHGMLFTNINLDAFDVTLTKFMDSIKSIPDGQVEEREWVMMGVINLASVLEYGKAGGILRRCMGGTASTTTSPPTTGPSRANKRERDADTGDDADRMDVDEPQSRPSPIPTHSLAVSPESSSPSFTNAFKLTFTLLSHVLKHPLRRPSPYSHRSVNPYISILLTFLATILKSGAASGTVNDDRKTVLEVVERFIPWHELAEFLSSKIPRSVWESQGLVTSSSSFKARPVEERWPMLTSSTAPPLPEDWCLRGMEWVGRKVYERGFWKSNGGEDEKFSRIEVEYLCESERGKGDDGTDGKIEDDDDDVHPNHVSAPNMLGRAGGVPMILTANGARGGTSVDVSLMPPPRRTLAPADVNVKRFVRILRCGITIASLVPGFAWVEGTREISIIGPLADHIRAWDEERRAQELEEETRRMRLNERRMEEDPDMEVDAMNSEESTDEDDGDELEEVKVLKARRRYLKSLLQSAQLQRQRELSPPRRRIPRTGKRTMKHHSQLHSILPGYTVLVIDTNILLSSLSNVSSLVDSLRWTVLLPSPVVMELQGLSSNPGQLGEAAKEALAFTSTKMKTHGLSLKVQTTRGNYLNSLGVVAEEVDFSDASDERNMDDLILKIAMWHEAHWVDRSAMLAGKDDRMEVEDPIKVLLLSLDRNLRLKARSRQLAAAGEKDLASILTLGT